MAQLIRYLGIEVDDDLSTAEQVDLLITWGGAWPFRPTLDPRREPHCSGSEAHIPNILQPEGWLWGTAHGSISIQEGQQRVRLKVHVSVAAVRGRKSPVPNWSEISGNPRDLSKSTFKNDIYQFESSHPSRVRGLICWI
jgi:hypothetical protein